MECVEKGAQAAVPATGRRSFAETPARSKASDPENASSTRVNGKDGRVAPVPKS